MPKREFSLHIQSAFPCRTSKRIVAKRSSRDQHAACHGDHHGLRLSAGPLPDSSSRRSLAGWADFHLLPLRTLQITDETLGMVIEGKVKNAGFIQATRSAGREKGRRHGPDILLFYLRAVLFLSLITLYGCQELVPHYTQSLLISGFKRSEIFGIVAGFGTTFAAVPDLIAMLRRRSSAGMHPRMAAIMGAFQILWVYYGLLIASRPVILWNVVAVLVNSLSVGAYLYFVRKEKGQAKE